MLAKQYYFSQINNYIVWVIIISFANLNIILRKFSFNVLSILKE